MAIQSGVEVEPVRESTNVMERYDWLYMSGELDEDTSLYLLRQTMNGHDWICWQITEPWW